MTQKVRFVTIVALGLGVLTGVAATAHPGAGGRTAVTADGTGTPASTATPLPPLPTGHQDTWGWG